MSEFIIRPAEPRDLEAINTLLRLVLAVHHAARPDLFRPAGKKYTDEELLSIFDNPNTPVFVYDREGAVLGYVFCAIQHQDSGALMPITTLYVDDLCVMESVRGLHIGTSLFKYVKAFAKEKGCHNITLHVWEGNPGAKAFYESQGMAPQFTSMELLCK
ncbi:MAG: GNAT family N-acetyltransferase [Bacteroidales bacterium]|nr:GNAT family N-acetyltransferase [Bacteroidales bacterium]